MFVAGFLKTQTKRVELLKKKLGMKKVVLMPVHFQNHWTLVVVDGRESVEPSVETSVEPRLLYMDSLRTEAMVLDVWAYVHEGLKELMGWSLPLRWNAARQELGSDTCGTFVLHYMEQCCRALLLQEPWCSLGWPSHTVWGERAYKLTRAMKTEQEKIKTEEGIQDVKKKKLEEKTKKAADAKKKADAVDLKMDELAVVADASMKKIPPGKPCLENLSAKARAEVNKVHVTGAGICAKCRWSSGCYECDGAHAVLYWLKQEGFDKELVLKLDAEVELNKLDGDDVD